MARKVEVRRWKRRGKPESKKVVRDRVRMMAACGKSEDAIAYELGIHKNVLRARYILDLDAGREIARAASAAAEGKKLSVKEQELEDALNAGFDENGNAYGYWMDEDGGNLLAHGCKTRAEYDAYRARLKREFSNE